VDTLTQTWLCRTERTVDKRAKRHLDDLERSNYTEPSAGATGNLRFRPAAPDGDDIGPLNRADAEANKKRKTRPTAVQMLLMYRKNLPTLIKESVRVRRSPSTQAFTLVTPGTAGARSRAVSQLPHRRRAARTDAARPALRDLRLPRSVQVHALRNLLLRDRLSGDPRRDEVRAPVRGRAIRSEVGHAPAKAFALVHYMHARIDGIYATCYRWARSDPDPALHHRRACEHGRQQGIVYTLSAEPTHQAVCLPSLRGESAQVSSSLNKGPRVTHEASPSDPSAARLHRRARQEAARADPWPASPSRP
jgi:hypothetical protein